MACMPARYDFAIYEGVDCKALKTTLNKDISGATITFTAAPKTDSSSPILEISGVVDDDASGQFHIPITASQTSTLASDGQLKLVYDVFITISGENESPLFGVVTLNPKVKA